MKKKVGVLSLQGDFEAHQRALDRAGAHAVQVRTPAHLAGLDGLVIPGGESTTMLKLLNISGLMDPLRQFGAERPVFGTCAGAILLARSVSNPVQESLDLMEISVERNGYGRQLDSCIVQLEPEGFAGGPMEAVFIRAPIIREASGSSKVLAAYSGTPVLVEQGRHLVATFHPELTQDSRVHRHFLEKIA